MEIISDGRDCTLKVDKGTLIVRMTRFYHGLSRKKAQSWSGDGNLNQTRFVLKTRSNEKLKVEVDKCLAQSDKF
ncbi:hypothetical protein OSB04_011643 [Centaurea solstitialis]|uniref:Uncharacterized protein n=1 Tax=Centaurea solstitialis TaxID=347529 RepID=A0AA38WPB7_9ASTR|nr:hypothetical protein OSB04_011643 [Centaurea solstitialis]